MHQTKTLTFATVKHANRPKENSSLQEGSSFVGLANEHKKQLHAKPNPLLEKERFSNLTERNEKTIIERPLEKKDLNVPKAGYGLKGAVLALDDFACTE
jgi:hypothetical protein